MSRTLMAVAAATAFAALYAGSALAANPVTGLTVAQGEGYATLAWTPVEGATDYQIERTPVSADDVPTGTSTIVGLWQGQRTITPANPRFADAGFALGGRYQWRVRARFGAAAPQDWSEPVFGTTRPQWGAGPGAGLRTQWESSGNATYTSHANELLYTAALDAASDRMRVVEIGRTNPVATGNAAPGNREINMFILGYPAPKATAAAISSSPTIAYYCNVHGDEPQGRESCLIFARMLSFTEDPHILEILSKVNVLIIPSSNPNGRAANTRGNETGTDLNRDHAEIAQPETKALAAVLRDYTPEVGIDLHEGDSEDLPILSSRHLNVYEGLFREGKLGLVEGWMYDAAAQSGWWMGPYNNGGDSIEGILRNTFGLKNAVGMLAENRPSGGTTRPAEGTQLANRNRKSYGSLWEEFQALEYYFQNLDRIHETVEASKAFNRANVGRVVLRGSYPWPYDPRLGANTGVPSVDAPLASRIIDPRPCGYFVTNAVYTAQVGTTAADTLQLRLGLHGVKVDDRPAGRIVRLAQELRGLIPMLLDTASVAPQPIAPGSRLFECPQIAVDKRSIALAAVEETSSSTSLAITNEALEVDEPLNWTITEAETDCASPSDVGWLSAVQTAGSTPSAGGTSSVQVTVSAAGLTAPAKPTALLCLRSNDAGESLIAIPVSLQVLYPFSGFLAPLRAPAVTAVNAGSTVPVKFSLNGDRGPLVRPLSQRVDCTTLAPIGAATPIASPGGSPFAYDAATDTYQVNWKTEKSWAGTCRAVTLSLNDGTSHSAYVRFH